MSDLFEVEITLEQVRERTTALHAAAAGMYVAMKALSVNENLRDWLAEHDAEVLKNIDGLVRAVERT